MLRRTPIALVLTALAVATTANAQEVAPGVEVIAGRFVAGVQPDGNTVVIHAPDGLIVVDTGRHAEHTQAILDLAAKAGVPIAAVINTHWHLDHIGGNPRVRRAYPKVRVYASSALAGARTGFLAGYRAQLVDVIAATKDPAAKSGYQAEVAIIDSGDALTPDETVSAGGPRTIAGRALRLGLEGPAVTKGDVWVLDPATGVLAAGDLVTLPVPLLDTACARGWQEALAHLAKLDFTVLVPGHGPPMTRAQLETYRTGFDRLLACAASTRSDAACIDGWLGDLDTLVPASDRDFARTLLQYYLPSALRADPSRTARLCDPAAPAGTPTP
jgi:glyoxylase-like metal-dependent hydrolase (beta-lactamase superfamily II)